MSKTRQRKQSITDEERADRKQGKPPLRFKYKPNNDLYMEGYRTNTEHNNDSNKWIN